MTKPTLPYRVVQIPPQRIFEMRAKILTPAFMESAAKEPDFRDAIAKHWGAIPFEGEIPAYFKAVMLNSIKDLGILRLLKPGDPAYELVRESVAAYQAKHPNANMKMPAFVAMSATPLAFGYLPWHDTIILTTRGNFTPEVMKQVIAHELGHKDMSENQQRHTIQYSTPLAVEHIAPNLYRDCRASGLTDEQIGLLLPSDRYASVLSTTSIPFATRTFAMRLADATEWETNFTKRVGASWKLATATADCKAAFTKIDEEQPRILERINNEANIQSRRNELEADRRGAAVVGARAMIDALRTLHKTHNIHITPEEEIQRTHPSLTTREKNLGGAPAAPDR